MIKSLEAFENRKHIIESKERNRIEIAVNTEVEDFIRGRENFNLLSKKFSRGNDRRNNLQTYQ